MASSTSANPPSSHSAEIAVASNFNSGKSPSNRSVIEALKDYRYGQTKQRTSVVTSRSSIQPSNMILFFKAGLPFILFSVGATFVLKSAVEGKNLERDKSKGLISKSERQARLDAEKDQMIEKLNKKLKTQNFDNTKRIERPEEILERRKREREERNIWYKRTWRWITGQQ